MVGRGRLPTACHGWVRGSLSLSRIMSAVSAAATGHTRTTGHTRKLSQVGLNLTLDLLQVGLVRISTAQHLRLQCLVDLVNLEYKCLLVALDRCDIKVTSPSLGMR